MDDRDKRGRFLPGVPRKAGPGRPPRSVEERALEQVKKAFANGNLGPNLLDPWIRRCKKGDLEAIRLALAYLVGTPEQTLRLLGAGVGGEIVIELVRRVIGTEDPVASDVASAAGEDPG